MSWADVIKGLLFPIIVGFVLYLLQREDNKSSKTISPPKSKIVLSEWAKYGAIAGVVVGVFLVFSSGSIDFTTLFCMGSLFAIGGAVIVVIMGLIFKAMGD